MYPNSRKIIPSSKSARRWFATALFAAGVSIACAAPDAAHTESARTQDSEVVLMERYTVAGTGMAMDTLKYPGSVSVLVPSDLEQKSDIIQSLSQVPGFETGLDNGRSVGQQFTIRGFGYQSEDRVIVEQDGVRRSTSLYSNLTSSFRVDSDLLKQVEVVKGASSIMHGGGAIGGVVSMTAKDAADFIQPGNKMGAVVKLRYETNGVTEGSVGAAVHGKGWTPEILAYVKVAHKGDLTLSEELTDSTGRTYDTVQNKEDLRTYFLKAAWNPGEGQRLSVSYFRYEDETEVTWQSLFNTEYATTGPVKGTLSEDDWVARYTLAPATVGWLNLTAVASYSKAGYDRGYTSVSGAGVTTRLDYDNSDERLGFKLENLFRWKTGSISHRALAGFDYQHREEDAVYVSNGVLSYFGSMPNKYDDYGLYVQEEASLIDGRLVVQLGGRFDSFQREVMKKSLEYDNDHFSPRVGFSFEIIRGLALLGNFSESFRAPTPHETCSEGPLNINYYYLPNPDLKPEIAREFEFGFSWQRENLLWQGDQVRAKAVYFTGKIEDMITLVADYNGPRPPPGTNYYATYENTGKVKRDGVEVELAYRTRYWGVNASYEMLDQRDAVTQKKVPYGFADKIQVGVRLHPFAKEQLMFSAGLEHWLPPRQNPKTLVSGGVVYDYVNDDYTQVNASVSWAPTRTGVGFLDSGMEFRIGVNNLFNAPRLHSSNVTTSTRVGLGTNVFVSVLKRF